MRGSMLKEILQEQGISISELARRLNVSAQTLYSMVKRDNQKVDFDMMMHICKLLNVPVERLCEDNALPKMPDLREWQFIGKYRRLSESGRELVNMVIDHELSRREEEPSVNSPESKIIPLTSPRPRQATHRPPSATIMRTMRSKRAVLPILPCA